MDISKLFAGLGNTVGNIAQGIGNDFSSGVQNFQKQASNLLAPQQSGQQPGPQIQNPLGNQQVPLFIKPPQPQQQSNPFGGPLSPQVQENSPSSPFDVTNPGTPPVPPAQQPGITAPQQGTDQDFLNKTLNLLEGAAKNIATGVFNNVVAPTVNTMVVDPYNAVVQAEGQNVQNAGNPLQAAVNTTGTLAQNTIGNPQVLADEASFAIGGPEAGAGVGAGFKAGLAGAGKLALENLTNPALLAKSAGAFGLAGGLQGYGNSQPGQRLQDTIGGAVGGALSAPFFAGGAPLVGGLASKALSPMLARGAEQAAQRSIPVDDFNTFGKDFATPEGQQAVLGKIQQAVTNQPDFQSALENTASQIDGRAISNIKSPTSIIGKVIENRKEGETNYSTNDVGDILRGSIEMPDQKSLGDTVTAVKQEAQQRGWNVDKEQDFFKKPGPNNYQGYHVDVSLPDGTKGEIQIHTPESYASARLTHDQYDAYGNNAPAPVKKTVNKLQTAIKKTSPDILQGVVANKEVQQLPNTLSPMEKDFTKSDIQQSRSAQLQSQKEQLQAIRENSDQIPKDIQDRQTRLEGIKNQLQAGKVASKNADKQTRLGLKQLQTVRQQAHDDLEKDINSRLTVHRTNVKEQNARIDATTKDLDTQIAQEQARERGQEAVQDQMSPNQKAFKSGTTSLPNTQPLTDQEKGILDFPTMRPDEDMQANGHTTDFQPTSKKNVIQRNIFPSVLGRLKNATDMRVRKIGYGLQEAQSWGLGRGQNAAYNLSQIRKQFTPLESANATDALEGKVPAASARVQQWVNAARQEGDRIFQSARQVGIPVKYLQNHFPHTYTKETIDQISNDHDFQQAAIKAGYAKTPAEAKTYLQKSGGRVSPREVGSLHEHRLDRENKYPYVKDPRVMEEYLKNSYKEVGYTSAFGSKMGKLNQMLNGTKRSPGVLSNNPEEGKAVLQALRLAGAIPNEQKTPSGELQTDFFQGLRNFNTVTSLSPGTSPLSHVPALGHAATRLGVGNVVRGLGTLPKALTGKYTPEQLQNVTRYTEDNTADLYGSNGGRMMQKFYKATGIPWTLDKISAVVHNGAQNRLSQITQDLTTPEAKADLLKAGLNYNKIVQRGYLQPSERYQYVNEALKDSSLELSGLDMPSFAQNPVGKLAMQLTGPEQLAARRFAPYVGERLKNGNLGTKATIAGGLAITGGLGVASQEGKNLLANKPAQPLSQTAEEGIAQSTGLPGASDLVDAIQYPEYNWTPTGNPIADTLLTAGVNTVGGPIVGKIQNAQQIAQGLFPGASKTTQQEALRTAMRNIPLAGTPIANTFFPGKTYAGNRPSDQVLSLLTGKPVTRNNGAETYTAPGSLADIFRQNPQVSQASAQQNNYFNQRNADIAKLSTGDQATFKDIQGKEAQGTDAAYAAIDSDYLQSFGQGTNSAVWNLAASSAKQDAQMYKMPVEPQYSLSPADAKAYLQYETANPSNQAQMAMQNPAILETERQQSLWEQDPQVQKYKQAIAQQYGQTYTKPLANPLFSNDANGQPLYSNADIAAKNAVSYYENQNPPQTAAADELKAQYPYAQMELASQPYETAKLQQQYTTWAQANPNSSWQDFSQQYQMTNGYGPNMTGVSPTGQILPAYDIRS